MKYFILLGVAIVLVLGLAIYFWFPGLIVETMKHYARWRAGLTRQEIHVDDHRWAYLTGGQGEPVVIVHGFGGDKYHWVTFLTPFDRARYRVIVPDLPGFGENSRLLAVSYDVPSQVERLHRFVEQMGIGPFHLIGVSMGGCIAGYYASEYPEEVRSLALVDAAGVKGCLPSDMEKREQDKGKRIFLVSNPDEFEELMAFLFHNPPEFPKPFRAYFARQAELRYKFNIKIINDLKEIYKILLDDRLPLIQAPTLVIWGAEDRIFHISSAVVFKKGIKDCQTFILEECGHLPYLEKPAVTREAYWRFVSELS